VTVEGENYMIAQQTTRGLLKLLSSSPSSVFVNAWEGVRLSIFWQLFVQKLASAFADSSFLG